MLIVDTNVISELMRPAPTGSVAQWFEQQPLEQLAITAVTVGEILYGLDLLPGGQRKVDLASRFATVLQRAFSGYALPFDDAAAAVYARIRGDRNRAGKPISINDAMIAAIARTQSGAVVTRNVADFENCGLDIINPWTVSGGQG